MDMPIARGVGPTLGHTGSHPSEGQALCFGPVNTTLKERRRSLETAGCPLFEDVKETLDQLATLDDLTAHYKLWSRTIDGGLL